MITVTNEKGTFSVSAEEFTEKFIEHMLEGINLHNDGLYPTEVEIALLDFLQGYSGVE